MKKVVFIALLFLMGCSPFEFARLLGTGTKTFKEKGRSYSKVFDEESYASYDKVVSILREMGTHYIRGRRDKGFIVVSHFDNYYRFCIEATEVAVFFEEIEKAKTRVKVASLNYSLAEFISRQIFNGLEGKPLDQSYRKRTAGGQAPEDEEKEKEEEVEDEEEATAEEADSEEQTAAEQEPEEETEEEKE